MNEFNLQADTKSIVQTHTVCTTSGVQREGRTGRRASKAGGHPKSQITKI